MSLVAPTLTLEINFSSDPLNTSPADGLLLQTNQSSGVSSFVVIAAGSPTPLKTGDVFQIGTGATAEVLVVNTFSGVYPGTVTTTTPTLYAHTTAEPITTWIDVTAYLENETLEISRGRQHELGVVEAGRCTFRLYNNDRRFDPTNTSGPYYPLLLDRQMRLSATWSATTYRLFTGYITEFPPTWPNALRSWVDVKAADLFDLLARKNITSTLYQSKILADSPAGYWRLGDPIGSYTVADSSGHGYTGTINGAPALGADASLFADLDSAIDFSGVTGFITLPAASAPSGTGNITIELWAKVNAINLGSFSYIPLYTTDGDYLRVSVVAGGLVRFSAYDTNQNNGGFIDSDIAINDGKDHEIVAVRPTGTDPTSWHLYIDGVLRTVTPTVVGTGLANVPTSTVAVIGGRTVGGLAAAFDGKIDEVAIYTAALTQTQVTTHYNAGIGLPASKTGARIGNILDIVGVPSALRAIDTGSTTIPAVTASLVKTKALKAMQDSATSENGLLFMNAAGKITFYSRTRTQTPPFTTSQATFGDAGDGVEIGYQEGSPSIVYNLDDTYNEVTVTPSPSGTTQVASDAASGARYGERTLNQETLAIDDTENQSAAQYLLGRYKTPLVRVRQIAFMPAWNNGQWFPQALTRELWDRITARKRPPGGGTMFEQAALIEGINHKVRAGNWVTSFSTSTADTATYLILDDSTQGKLDSGNALAY